MIPGVDDAVRAVGDHLGLPSTSLRGSLLDTTEGLRSVLRIDWPGGPGAVAKLYSDDSGERTYRVQAALAAQVGADAPHLAIPEPLTYDAASRILIQRIAPGDGLATRIAHGDAAVMDGAGRAVAALHALDLPGDPPTSIDDHMAALMRPHPRELADAVPELAVRIEALIAGLRDAAPPADAFRAPIHRDLHPRQMIISDGQVSIVDWDLAGVGDPALDLGNLRAWLDTHLHADDAQRTADRFLAAYSDVAGDGAFPRIDTYRAFTHLRLACKRFRLGRDVATEVVPMVTAAEALLESS